MIKMKRYNNVNYHRLTPIIKQFIKQASDLTVVEEAFTPDFLEWWLEEGNSCIDPNCPMPKTELVCYDRTPIIHHYKKMCAVNPNDTCEETFEIRYNLEELTSKGHTQFRKDFEKRCPMARGFSDITISLLHELGHHACGDNEYEDYNREEELKFIEQLPKEMINLFYFLLPDEMDATNWAIEWLQKPNNRKIAKQFEKKFFNCIKNT
jgi:hypothetical protein